MDLKRGIDKATIAIVAELKKLAKPCVDTTAASTSTYSINTATTAYTGVGFGTIKYTMN